MVCTLSHSEDDARVQNWCLGRNGALYHTGSLVPARQTSSHSSTASVLSLMHASVQLGLYHTDSLVPARRTSSHSSTASVFVHFYLYHTGSLVPARRTSSHSSTASVLSGATGTFFLPTVSTSTCERERSHANKRAKGGHMCGQRVCHSCTGNGGPTSHLNTHQSRVVA
jgi:hypothetical protein